MPLKLCVGTSQKIGQPDFGSLGASCEVEIELFPSLLHDDLDAFHRHVRHAYVACRQAVTDELARCKNDSATSHSPASTFNSRPITILPNANNGNNGNGTAHRASQKQCNYANQLAERIPGLEVRRMESLARKMFGKPLADLSSLHASALIDTLKAIKDGQIKLEDALDGAPA